MHVLPLVSRRGRLRLVGICAALAGCGATDPSQPYGSSESAIVGGQSDATDNGVVALFDGNQVLCSGTVIAPRVVLTAAHCLYSCGPAALPEVSVGQTPGAARERFEAAADWIHPLYDPVSHDNDIALLVLTKVLPVPPVPMNRASPGNVVGDAVRVVGFGRTSATVDGSLTRHEGTSVVASIEPTTFRLRPDPSLPCYGDSGGPVLLAVGGIVQIYGVVSFGNEDCTSYAVATKVTAYANEFLDSFAALDALPAGGRCLFDGNCESGHCIAPPDAPKVAYCDGACSAPADCPSPMVCEGAEGGLSCRYPEPSPGATGTSCASATDCNSAVCAHPAGSAASLCTTACFPNDNDACPTRYDCVTNPEVSGAFACFPPASSGASCAAHGGKTDSADAALLAIATLSALSGRRRRQTR
jgi:uncharacterized Zn-binding protein involved in type VI secretion